MKQRHSPGTEVALSSSVADLPYCPSCRNPMLQVTAHRCPLCGFALDAGEVISDDATPFAAAEACGYWSMTRWVLTAGSMRLGFLARMRRSRASSQYALMSLVLLSAAAGVWVMADIGWHRVTVRSVLDELREPTGSGWKLVANAPLPEHNPGRPVLAQLWWHPVQWFGAIIIVPLATMALSYLVLVLVRAGADSALPPSERGQDRFGAAIHYSTAHACILLAAALCYGTRIVHSFSEVQGWWVRWPHGLHVVPAFLLGIFGLLMAWFWWIRLAQASPSSSRGRVSRHFGLWSPLLAVLVLGGWMSAVYQGFRLLAEEANIEF